MVKTSFPCLAGAGCLSGCLGGRMDDTKAAIQQATEFIFA